jgi:microsomal dipeptidase-like Zn-dependent dipeptidase
MMTNNFYVDLHSHITLFPYNLGKENKEGMLYSKNPLIREDLAPNYTQTDIPKMVNGGVRIVFAALYPIEKGFMRIRGSEKEIADNVIHLMTNFPDERIKEIQSDSHSYFHDLQLEYNFLSKQQDIDLKVNNNGETVRYKIVSDFSDLKDFILLDNAYAIDESKTRIAIVLTIEGAHAFLPNSTEEIRDINVEDLHDEKTISLLNSIKQNIAWAKSKKVFAVTFDHHFYNYLSGQSISFTKMIDTLLQQEEKSRSGFTALGVEVLKELMSSENDQRPIIIDVKHLSVIARKWFYEQEFTKGIPVIASHTAVNGYKTMNESIEDNDTHNEAQSKYDRSIDYNNWDLNLSDEEIVIIARRKGLIGISVDQRVVMGKKRLDDIKDSIGLDLFPTKVKDKKWSYPIFDTIIHIATVLQTNGCIQEEIWDNIAIGSDFDGLINPINAYRTVEEYPKLQENLLLWFNESKTTIPVLKGLNDEQLNEIVHKIMNKNCLHFLEQYFI